MRRRFLWNNFKKLGFLLILGVGNQAYSGADFEYFGSKIDFWKEGRSQESGVKKKQEEPKSPTAKTSDFQWDKYLDPKNKDFFKEGEYTPPEPFMEVVRNPSDANLKNWFAYIDKKNELTRKLQERMNEYLAKNAPSVEPAAQTTLKQRLAALPLSAPDSKRFRFRLYFDSHCPHCKHMFETLNDLQKSGFFVEARQVDTDPRGLEGLGIPISRVVPGEVQAKDIQSVPVLLIGDLKKKEVYRLTGYQSTANVISALRQAQ